MNVQPLNVAHKIRCSQLCVNPSLNYGFWRVFHLSGMGLQYVFTLWPLAKSRAQILGMLGLFSEDLPKKKHLS